MRGGRDLHVVVVVVVVDRDKKRSELATLHIALGREILLRTSQLMYLHVLILARKQATREILSE